MTAMSSPMVAREIRDAANALAGNVRAITLGAAGANSRIFRVETDRGPVALKFYPSRPGETRNRQDVEWRTLGFLHAHGVKRVPRPLARDEAGHFMTMEWVEGSPVTAPSLAEIEAACGFIAAVFRLSDLPEAADFPPASEACLAPSEILRQIAVRLESFGQHADLDRFLQERFRPALAHAEASLGGKSIAAELPLNRRRLIPADFGFHNAFRTPAGLRFFDFEYFGWDDPVKLTADLMLHPGVPLADEGRALVARRIAEALAEDEDFKLRLERDYPLYRLRWVLILLNPFRRDRAPALPENERARIFATQLAKAAAMLDDA